MNQALIWSDFEKVDIRTGTILHAEIFAEAKTPAYKLQIDFGALGIKKSSAQITVHYSPEKLIGKQIVAVVNFPPKQIGPFMSECLVLGVVEENGGVVLLQADKECKNGLRVS